MTLADLTRVCADEAKARELLEQWRWPDGPVCPRCGSHEARKLTPRATSKAPVRPGVFKCRDCRRQFTVTVGTVFEDSHVPISKWILAMNAMCASKKGVSAHQLHRQLGVTYKTAWFMAHRLREAMKRQPLAGLLKGVVEVDETYVGGKNRGPGGPTGRATGKRKAPVVALVERGGRVRSFHMERLTAENLKGAIKANVAPTTHMMSDEFKSYTGLQRDFASHQTVTHSQDEYARGPRGPLQPHINTAEAFFSLLKRGVNGTFHHISKTHLHRYLSEFDFRWNNRDLDDGTRTMLMARESVGRRLMYRAPVSNALRRPNV